MFEMFHFGLITQTTTTKATRGKRYHKRQWERMLLICHSLSDVAERTMCVLRLDIFQPNLSSRWKLDEPPNSDNNNSNKYVCYNQITYCCIPIAFGCLLLLRTQWWSGLRVTNVNKTMANKREHFSFFNDRDNVVARTSRITIHISYESPKETQKSSLTINLHSWIVCYSRTNETTFGA